MPDFDQAIRLNPESVNAYNDRGVAWSNAKEYDQAIADYTEAIAAAHAEASNFELAVKWESQAIELANDEEAKAECLSRLELYRQKKPYRTTDP